MEATRKVGVMKRVLATVIAVILSMGLGASVAAQLDEEDCAPLPNADTVTKCERSVFSGKAPNGLVIVVRVEYESEKVADESFDELFELFESTKDETGTPLKPTNDYKRLGVGDAVQGEDDEGFIGVMLRDDKAIIIILGTIDDDLLYALIETMVEEDEMPKETEDLELVPALSMTAWNPL